MKNIYSKIDYSKNNILIPFFFDNKPMFSTYNPNRDIDLFLRQFEVLENPTCVFIAGVGTAQHIQKLNENPKISKIICMEYSNQSLEFLEPFLLKSTKIVYCTLKNYKNAILENYIPQIHGGFFYAEVKSWVLATKTFSNEFEDNSFKENLLDIIKSVSRDYSTQSFFGKIWHRNIILNLENYAIACKNNLLLLPSDFPTEKTAIIVGASPNLDQKFKEIAKNREKYFIFATDTSYPVLIQRDIFPDSVVTLDGQIASSRHFIHNHSNKTFLIGDFCSNPNIIRDFVKKNCKIAFTNSGHPLSNLFAFWGKTERNKNLTYNVSAGNGTVLQLALDFALSIGFTKYEIFGAEFAYTQSKPYCKGTYFDFQYNSQSTKINSTEQKYNELMFSRKTIPCKNGITTENLISYKEFLAKYENNKKYSENLNINLPNENITKTFFKWYLEKLEKREDIVKNSILPLQAWINNYNKNSDIYIEALSFTKKLLLSFTNEE